MQRFSFGVCNFCCLAWEHWSHPVYTTRLWILLNLGLFQGDYESCQMVSKKVLEEDPYHLSALPVARPAWLRPCRSSDTTKLNGQERIVRDLFTQILQDAVSFRRQALWYLMIVFDFHSIERNPLLRFISPPWWCSTWPTSLVWCACWRMQRDGSRLLYWSLTWQWSQWPESLELVLQSCMHGMRVRHLLPIKTNETFYCPIFDLDISQHLRSQWSDSSKLQDAFC